MSGDDDGSWHDKQEVILAAGVAGVILLALLVWAVIHTANKSTPSPGSEFPPSSATSSTYTTPSTSSTTYTVPRVQTSEDNPVLTGPPPSSTPDLPDDAETTTETTTVNPYPTTTPTNAGHI